MCIRDSIQVGACKPLEALFQMCKHLICAACSCEHFCKVCNNYMKSVTYVVTCRKFACFLYAVQLLVGQTSHWPVCSVLEEMRVDAGDRRTGACVGPDETRGTCGFGFQERTQGEGRQAAGIWKGETERESVGDGRCWFSAKYLNPLTTFKIRYREYSLYFMMALVL